GYKTTFCVGKATLNGKFISPVYRMKFRSLLPVFKLRRKAELHQAWIDAHRARTSGRNHDRWTAKTIVSWRYVEAGSTKCIAVQDPSHTYLATRSYTVTHNTNQITRWRVLWEIGKNPNIRVAIVSATEKLPKDVISGLRQDIEG